MSDATNPTRKDAGGPPPAEGSGEMQRIGVPVCPACKRQMPGFIILCIPMPLPDGSGTITLETWSCPHQDCQVFLTGSVVDRPATSKIATPGARGWPGVGG